jgi:hypothetical protein
VNMFIGKMVQSKVVVILFDKGMLFLDGRWPILIEFKRDVVESGPIFEEIFLEVMDDGYEAKEHFIL